VREHPVFGSRHLDRHVKLVRGPDGFIAILHSIGTPVADLLGWTAIVVEIAGGLMILIGSFVPAAAVAIIAVLLPGELDGAACLRVGTLLYGACENDHLSGFVNRWDIMKAVKTYPTRVEADLAKISLDAAGVPSVVVGIGVDLEGGAAGVQLLVPDECVEAALRVLDSR